MHLCDKIIFANRDENTGRLFTSFCRIKKEIRDVCTLDGNPLIEVDSKSSQPFLWLSLLKKENPDNKNIEKLFNILLEKDIYLHFMELFTFENGSPDSRDDAKREFIRFLFKAAQGNVPFQKVCKQYYPDIYKLTQALKKKSGNLVL